MASPPAQIRPAAAARAYVLVFGAVWCALALSILLRTARHRPLVAVVVFLMLLVGVAVLWRASRLGAFAEGDRLTVRNSWSTRVLRREEIEDVRTGPAPTGGVRLGPNGIPLARGDSVLLLLRDGSVLPLQGARTRLIGDGRTQRAQVDQLRAWLRAA